MSQSTALSSAIRDNTKLLSLIFNIDSHNYIFVWETKDVFSEFRWTNK